MRTNATDPVAASDTSPDAADADRVTRIARLVPAFPDIEPERWARLSDRELDIFEQVTAETRPYIDPLARKLVSVRASSMKPRRAEWIWHYNNHGRIPLNALTLNAGRPGTGKSTYQRWLAAQMTLGTLPGCWLNQPADVCYVATEEDIEVAVLPTLIAASADLDRVHFLAWEGDDEQARIRGLDDKDDLLDFARGHNVKAFFLDPITAVTLDGAADGYRNNEVREAAQPWVEIAQAVGTVQGIVHLTKAARDITSGINGSSAWGELARAVFGFAHDRDSGERVLSQTKNSFGAEGLNLSYRIESATVELPDGEGTTEVPRFILGDPTDRSAADMLRDDQATDRQSARSDAAQWLRGYLTTKGPTESLAVKAAGVDLGFKVRTVERAAQKLDVHQTRTREVPSKTVWSLPGQEVEA